MRRSFFSADNLFDTGENMVENFWNRILGILWPFAEETPSMECWSLNLIRWVMYENMQESVLFSTSSCKKLNIIRLLSNVTFDPKKNLKETEVKSDKQRWCSQLKLERHHNIIWTQGLILHSTRWCAISEFGLKNNDLCNINKQCFVTTTPVHQPEVDEPATSDIMTNFDKWK